MFILDFIVMHWMMILGVGVAVLVLFLIIFRSSLIRLEILQRIGAIGPYVTVSAVIATAIWAGDRWQTDATLKYIDKFIDREYAESLWAIQEFTLCFEKKNNHHISYVPYGNILKADADTRRKSLDLAREWWSLVENRQESPKVDCGKPKDLEMKLMVVYGRLDALASCAERGLCSWDRVEDMLETVDVAVLSIANYIRLTRERSLLKGDHEGVDVIRGVSNLGGPSREICV